MSETPGWLYDKPGTLNNNCFLIGCFSWMIPSLYIKNWLFHQTSIQNWLFRVPGKGVTTSSPSNPDPIRRRPRPPGDLPMASAISPKREMVRFRAPSLSRTRKCVPSWRRGKCDPQGGGSVGQKIGEKPYINLSYTAYNRWNILYILYSAIYVLYQYSILFTLHLIPSLHQNMNLHLCHFFSSLNI